MKIGPAALLLAAIAGGLASRYTAPSRAVGLTETGTPRLEVGFSPKGNAEKVVLSVIESANKTLRVSAYSFTSAPVTKALIAARKRGVDVQIVADDKNNAGSRYAKAAFGALVAAGIPVRLNDAYAIHHDKFIIADQRNVETGSFNYSAAAAERNSENALAIWNAPELARTYDAHWRSRFDEGRPFAPDY